MKILLTGACGQVAKAIMRHSDHDHAHEFVPLDISKDVEALANGICASVTDRHAMIRAAAGCDAIIHTAALHGRFKDKLPNQDFIATNVIGAENVCEAALANGIRRIVMSSTLEVLCGIDWTASGRAVLHESMPPRPDWIYPVTKLMAEELGQFHVRNNGLEVVQLRYAWVIDEEIAAAGVELLARGVVDSDVATANLLAVTTPGLRDHMLLIGPTVPFTQSDIELAQADPYLVVEHHWPGSADVLRRRGRKLKPDHFWPVCRIDRARQVLGWQPKVTFERFLRGLGWHSPVNIET